MSGEVAVSEISGFWRRLGAGIADVIVLALVGFAIGYVAEDFLAGLGQWGVAIGIVICAAYFGVLNSALANGQTFGKILLGLQVVGSDNKPVSLAKSMVRYLIFGLPVFLGGMLVTAMAGSLPLLIMVFVPVLVIVFGSFYLLVFNRVTRQTIYDLIVGTYVVKIASPSIPVGSVWKPHFGFIGGFVGLVIVATVVLPGAIGAPDFAVLAKTRSVLLEEPEITDAGVQFVRSKKFQKETTTTKNFVVVRAILKVDRISDKTLAQRVKEIVQKKLPLDKNVDAVFVVLSYGFNIGIAKRYRNRRYKFDLSGNTT